MSIADTVRVSSRSAFLHAATLKFRIILSISVCKSYCDLSQFLIIPSIDSTVTTYTFAYRILVLSVHKVYLRVSQVRDRFLIFSRRTAFLSLNSSTIAPPL